LAEILREGQTALMFEAGDVQGIREAILRLAADPGLVAALGRNARRDQAERFTLERMGRQYLQVYREATGGLPAAGR
ncbi:MAG: glycosyltransferase, partial [Acidobacteriota bacterium]